MYVEVVGVGAYNVRSATYDLTQNEIGKINFEILYKDTEGVDLGFHDIRLVDGNYVFTGVLIEDPIKALTDGTVVLRCQAYTDLGRLMCVRSNSDAHYQNFLVSAIVQDLLSNTTDWTLTDTSTMVDPNDVTTIDLRSGKEVLSAQVLETIKSVPNVAIRYLGFNDNTGNHEVGIGNFGYQRWYAMQGENLINIDISTSSGKPLWKIEAYSDKSGDSRVTLADAVAYAPYLAHPDNADYPIVLDGIKYVVRDNSQSRGCSISKNYSIHKTKNDAIPTSTEIQQTAFSIWRQAIRDLQKNRRHSTYNITASFADVPLVSDRMFVRGICDEKVYDPITQEEVVIRSFEVNDWFRITAVKTDFQLHAGDELVFTVVVSDQDYAETVDPDVELYEALERHDGADKNALAISGSTIKGVTPVTVVHDPAIDPADGSCTGVAKKYVFSFGAVPPGSTNVFAFVTVVSPASAIVERVTEPVLPGTELELCVQVPGGGWSGIVPVSVSINYVFY